MNSQSPSWSFLAGLWYQKNQYWRATKPGRSALCGDVGVDDAAAVVEAAEVLLEDAPRLQCVTGEVEVPALRAGRTGRRADGPLIATGSPLPT